MRLSPVNTSNRKYHVQEKARVETVRKKIISGGNKKKLILCIISTFLCSSFNQLCTYINCKNRAVRNVLVFDIKKDEEKVVGHIN